LDAEEADEDNKEELVAACRRRGKGAVRGGTLDTEAAEGKRRIGGSASTRQPMPRPTSVRVVQGKLMVLGRWVSEGREEAASELKELD